ncbi:MAG TPA: AMP-binding protein, partial [Candidatus Limnocylindrales bacterium]|nr:AMP-binding protein [Candidatus Limnocylindrales bacterium]
MTANRLWLKNYPVRWNLDYPQTSLYDYITQSAKKNLDLVALVFIGSEITFREMLENIERMAAALHDLGVKKGDRVALMLPNCPQYVYTYYACMKLGAIVVQMNPLYTPREVEFILNDSGAKIFCGVDAVFNSFHEVRDQVPAVEHVIVGRLLWTEVTGDNIWYDELLQKNLPAAPAAEIDPLKDVAVFQYTGGTTGFPKAVMLSHYNLVSNVIQIKEWLKEWIDNKFAGGISQQYGLAVLPFFHSYGMTCVMNAGLTLPSGQVLIPRFDLELLLEMIKQYRPAIFPAVPTVYTAIANHPEADKYNLDSVEI